MVQQLAQCLDILPAQLQAIYDQYQPQERRPTEKEFSSLFQLLVAQFPHVYVVIDALDECHWDTRNRLAETLEHSPQDLHVLYTSRDLGYIQDLFAEASRLEIKASDGDISNCLNEQIQQAPKLTRFCGKSKGLQASIVGNLVEKANGMSVYMFFALVICLLCYVSPR